VDSELYHKTEEARSASEGSSILEKTLKLCPGRAFGKFCDQRSLYFYFLPSAIIVPLETFKATCTAEPRRLGVFITRPTAHPPAF
jgi:hypothetical protein